MSWIARSLATLGVEDDSEDEDQNITTTNNNGRNRDSSKVDNKNNQIDSSSTDDPSRGVKDDLSELTKTLTRQLWGVASFLAPPPSSDSSSSSSPPPPPPPPPPAKTTPTTAPTIAATDQSISDWNQWESFDQSVSGEVEDPHEDLDESDRATIAGIRSDFAEIGGRFRTGIERISKHKAVSEISKIASTFLPFGSEEDRKDLIGGAVGVTDEVLTFARNISMHPETWLDFPLADDEDSDDFDMSDAQQEHALAVERLAPRLAALRIELCPGYMSEGCFWKIYFVLLHSRLNKHDAELLSTPQIVEARAMLMNDIQGKTRSEPERSGIGASSHSREPSFSQQEHHFSVPTEVMPLRTFASEHSSSDFETEKHPVVSTDMQIIDKSVVEEEPVIQSKSKDLPAITSFKALDHNYEEDDDGDDWLKDESSEMGGFTGTAIPLGSEEDVSFSDLEEDDDVNKPTTSSKTVQPTKDSRDWIQLSPTPAKDDSPTHNPENKDSNDWLDVNEIDVA